MSAHRVRISDFYSEREVAARSDALCVFCRKTIPAGELRVRATWRSGGAIHAHEAHRECHATATNRAVGCQWPECACSRREHCEAASAATTAKKGAAA